MKKWLVFLTVVAGVSVAAPLFAHHGRGSTYDSQKQVSLKGTVAEVLWRNPHIGILLDVKDDSGNVVRWAIEHSNISTLARQGYGRTTLKAGQEVTAVVNPGSGGTPVGLCIKFILPDGKEIFQRGAGVD
jgi:hypothetical protein